MSPSAFLMTEAWPAPRRTGPADPRVTSLLEDASVVIGEELDLLGLTYEMVYCYCGEASDGRPLVAMHLQAGTAELAMIEDVNGQGWVVTAKSRSERQMIRRLTENDDAGQLGASCVRLVVASTGFLSATKGEPASEN